MARILIIYPNDPSTIFLLDAFNFLQKNITDATFYEISPNDSSHNKSIELIKNHDIIIFMGHGTYSKLSSASNDFYTKEYLITLKDLENLNNKLWLLFSCYSNDFLRRSAQYLISGIGFGNLPTDFNDIQASREVDANSYLNISEFVINEFRKAIVWIIIETVLSLTKEQLQFRELYNRMIILIDRKMIDSIENIVGNEGKAVAILLYEMKQESEFILSH